MTDDGTEENPHPNRKDVTMNYEEELPCGCVVTSDEQRNVSRDTSRCTAGH